MMLLSEPITKGAIVGGVIMMGATLLACARTASNVLRAHACRARC
jgi:hypothetical protein